jgi:hypothetical protein
MDFQKVNRNFLPGLRRRFLTGFRNRDGIAAVKESPRPLPPRREEREGGKGDIPDFKK